MIVRRWLVVRVKRSISVTCGLLTLLLLLLLGYRCLKETSLGIIFHQKTIQYQKREMVQYYPHESPGRASRAQEVGRVEVPEVQGWRRGEEGRKDGEGRRPGREEVVNALLDPVKPGVGGSGAPPNPAVHMFYYAWYGNLQTDGRWWHWDHRYLPHWDPSKNPAVPPSPHSPPHDIGAAFYPKLGPYSSRDPATLSAHMWMVAEAGAGVVALSWYPPGLADDNGPPSDPVVPLLLEAAHRRGLKVCLHMEPFTNRTVESVRAALLYANSKYSHHPAYYTLDKGGRRLPLFYIYDSYRIPAIQWARLFSPSGDLSVRNTEADGVFLGLLLDNKHRYDIVKSHLDGFYTYFASNGFTHGSTWIHWDSLSRFAARSGLLFVPSVGPGYEDTRIRRWNGGASRARREGTYYDTAWRAAVRAQPSAVSVTSFNEWGEGTQVEPAVAGPGLGNVTYLDYSPLAPEHYLRATAHWAARLQGGVTT